MYKVCSKCGENKFHTEFYSKKMSLEYFCKVCKYADYTARKAAIKIGTYVNDTLAEFRVGEFKAKSTKLHLGIYTYDKVEYVNNSTKVMIFCTKHGGYFYQSPKDHIKGNGCKDCGIIVRSIGRRTGLEEFIAQAKIKNCTSYDYSKVEYLNNSTKVLIGCRLHGDFQMSPAKHILGRGCQLCSREELGARFTSNTEEFISKAKDEHGDLYDYSKSVYIGVHTLLNIHCNTCDNDFQQKPNNHLSGRGCPTCSKSGYDKSKQGTFYILSCGDITKVGITNVAPKTRAASVSREYGREFTVDLHWTFQDGSKAYDMETQLLASLKTKYKQPTTKFDGYTECFLDVDRQDLLRQVAQYI